MYQSECTICFFQSNSNHDAGGTSSSKSKSQVARSDNTPSKTKLVKLKQLKLILEDVSKRTQPLRVGEDDEHASNATQVLNVKHLIQFEMSCYQQSLLYFASNIQTSIDHELNNPAGSSEISQQSDDELVRIHHVLYTNSLIFI